MRKLLFQTGLPYLGVALLLTGAVIYNERVLQQKADVTPITKIYVDNQNVYERIDVRFNVDSPLGQLAKTISNDMLSIKFDINDLTKDSRISALSSSDKAKLFANLAKNLMIRRDYKKANAILLSLNQVQRKAHSVQFIYAFSLSRLGQLSEAIKQYSLQTKHQPQDSAAFINLGLLLKKSGRYEDALPIFKRATEISSGSKKAKALASLAYCEIQLGQFNKAVQHYKESIASRPDSSHTWLALGQALAKSNASYQAALDASKKGVALNQQDTRAQLALAEFQLSNFDYTGASASLKVANVSSKNNLSIHRLQAWSYLEQGKRNSAKNHIQFLIARETLKSKRTLAKLMLLYANKQYATLISNAKKIKRRTAELNYLTGLAYRKANLYTKALTYFKPLSTDQNYNRRAQIQTARILRARKQYTEATELYQQLLRFNNQAAFLYFELSLVFERQSKEDQALTMIFNAIRLNPKSKVYPLTQARFLQLKGDIVAATQAIKRVLIKGPNYVRALKQLARTYQLAGNKNEALKTYRHILALQPNELETHIQYAELLVQRGDYDAAQIALINILEENTAHIEARYQLAHAYFLNKQHVLASKALNNVLKFDSNHTAAHELKTLLDANDE